VSLTAGIEIVALVDSAVRAVGAQFRFENAVAADAAQPVVGDPHRVACHPMQVLPATQEWLATVVGRGASPYGTLGRSVQAAHRRDRSIGSGRDARAIATSVIEGGGHRNVRVAQPMAGTLRIEVRSKSKAAAAMTLSATSSTTFESDRWSHLRRAKRATISATRQC
jgi:hypothetical protein